MYRQDIFLISLFVFIIALCEMFTQDILIIDMIQNVFSGNIITYTVLAIALSYFRKYQSGTNSELERTVLALNNELQRMHAENEWRNDAISQGKSTVCM